MGITVTAQKAARRGMRKCQVCDRETVKGDMIVHICSRAYCDTKTANVCKDCIDYFNDILFGRRLLHDSRTYCSKG